MIAVLFYRTRKNKLNGFSVIGHSGAGSHGEDIVCAAVSALSITAVNALEKVAGIAVSPTVGEGVLHVRIPMDTTKKQKRCAETILRTARLGLYQIAARHPRHVRCRG